METELAARVAHFRDLRRSVEANVLALATSVDGQRFEFQASLTSLDLRIGGYVVLETGAGDRLGQITSLEVTRTEAGEVGWGGDTSMTSRIVIRGAQGEGALLDRPRSRSTTPACAPRRPRRCAPGRRRPLRAARSCAPASCCWPRAWCTGSTQAASTATRSCAASRDPARRTRSACCSSSCSLRDRPAHRRARPQLRLRAPRRAARGRRPGARGALRGRDPERQVHRGPPPGSDRLRIRFGELGTAGRAAALRLDPIYDREEYAELAAAAGGAAARRARRARKPRRPRRRRARAARAQPRRRPLGRVGARDAGLDARRSPTTRPCAAWSSTSARSPRARSRRSPAEAVLERLWNRRDRREPVLIVIDEAHNVCPAAPEDAADRARDRARGADRRRGPQVRPLPADVHSAAGEGAPERRLAVRQPRADADELRRRPRLRARASSRSSRPGCSALAPDVPARRGARGRQAVLAPGAACAWARAIAEEGGADVPSTWAQRT